MFFGEVIGIFPYSYTFPNSRPDFYKSKIPVPNQKEINKYHNCLKLEDYAPDFTLDAIVNSRLDKITLSDYRGKWVVLFFYRGDFTFV